MPKPDAFAESVAQSGSTSVGTEAAVRFAGLAVVQPFRDAWATATTKELCSSGSFGPDGAGFLRVKDGRQRWVIVSSFMGCPLQPPPP
jgi:hypothetical protein